MIIHKLISLSLRSVLPFTYSAACSSILLQLEPGQIVSILGKHLIMFFGRGKILMIIIFRTYNIDNTTTQFYGTVLGQTYHRLGSNFMDATPRSFQNLKDIAITFPARQNCRSLLNEFDEAERLGTQCRKIIKS